MINLVTLLITCPVVLVYLGFSSVVARLMLVMALVDVCMYVRMVLMVYDAWISMI